MFSTQKMLLLDILVLQNNVEDVTQLIIETGNFEPSIYSSIVAIDEQKWTKEDSIDKKRNITELKKNSQSLYEFYKNYLILNKENPIIKEDQTVLTPPIIGDLLRRYQTKKMSFTDRYDSIRKRKEEIAIKITGLKMYNASNQQTQKTIKQQDVFHSILGVVSSSNLEILQYEFKRFNGELLSEGYVNDSEIIFITVSKDQVKDLNTLLDHLYFINYGLPSEFFGEGNTNMMKLGLEYTVLCDEEELLENEIHKVAPQFIYILKRIDNFLDLYIKVSEVRNSMRKAGHFILLSGWIPAKAFRTFKKRLSSICGNNYEISIADLEKMSMTIDIPTKLSNPKILKPFETLVTTFGIPNYNELDPTWIFAALYILMYGAMFGDVGQGVLLSLIGLLGVVFNKSSMRIIFGLMIWVGLSSTIFGILYGSYFGYESAYYTWVPEPLWFSPMHNIDYILMITILLGVVIILLSYILGIINAIRMKDWATLIFSHKGVGALSIYSLLLVVAYLFINNMVIPLYIWIILGSLTLFLGLERIWEALIYGHGSIKDWWMGFFDMFEFYLSMFTNTLSFVRVGAFALTHAALMMAVFTLRDLAGGDTIAANITVLIGNIFVICMEGFIVGIQTLRLEYYEFFSRFFRGTGRLFNPINHKIK